MPIPRKMSGREISVIEPSIVAMSMPRVEIVSAVHLYPAGTTSWPAPGLAADRADCLGGDNAPPGISPITPTAANLNVHIKERARRYRRARCWCCGRSWEQPGAGAKTDLAPSRGGSRASSCGWLYHEARSE